MEAYASVRVGGNERGADLNAVDTVAVALDCVLGLPGRHTQQFERKRRSYVTIHCDQQRHAPHHSIDIAGIVEIATPGRRGLDFRKVGDVSRIGLKTRDHRLVADDNYPSLTALGRALSFAVGNCRTRDNRRNSAQSLRQNSIVGG